MRGNTLRYGWALSLATLVLASCQAHGDPFVRITGDQFTLNGQVYRLKGTNYYPQAHQWANMWSSWDWPAIQAESTMISGLGMNCVRILVPYKNGGWNGATPPADRLQMLENVVNEFGRKGVRSVVTLFDWETSFPAAGTATETSHLSHLRAIVDRLKDNPYVLMWDVKNEPDHPANYGSCDCNPGACGDWDCNPTKRDQIVSWLHRMCDAVRARDPNHPVSAGMRWWQNLPDVLNFVDVAIFHSYWPNIASEEIPQTKGYMGTSQKPILVEEWGWPSNPNPCVRDGQTIVDYNENVQLGVYVSHLGAIAESGIAGGLQWMTFDAKVYTTNASESFENYFGLWYADYSTKGLKPAGRYYRDNFPVKRFPTLNDTTPPGPVANLAAAVSGSQIHLSWTAPGDLDFTGTVVRFGTSGYPTSPTDGQLLLNSAGLPATPMSCDHTALQPGVTCYYTLFAYDTSRNYAPATRIAATPPIPQDLDRDGDVDLDDFGLLQRCLTGRAIPQTDPTCTGRDYSPDGAVDINDLRIFLRCMAGPAILPNPSCAE